VEYYKPRKWAGPEPPVVRPASELPQPPKPVYEMRGEGTTPAELAASNSLDTEVADRRDRA
jgi:hypothetical protein